MLPQHWVDELFSRLSLRYGRAFLAQWQDGDLAAVKADWARALTGLDKCPQAISYALDHLPERPPTATVFRDLARQYAPPLPQLARLEAPAPREGAAEAVKQALEAAKREHLCRGSRTPAQALLDGIVERVKLCGRITPMQRQQVAYTVRVLAADDPRRETLRELGFTFAEVA